MNNVWLQAATPICPSGTEDKKNTLKHYRLKLEVRLDTHDSEMLPFCRQNIVFLLLMSFQAPNFLKLILSSVCKSHK